MHCFTPEVILLWPLVDSILMMAMLFKTIYRYLITEVSMILNRIHHLLPLDMVVILSPFSPWAQCGSVVEKTISVLVTLLLCLDMFPKCIIFYKAPSKSDMCFVLPWHHSPSKTICVSVKISHSVPLMWLTGFAFSPYSM